MDTIIQTPDTYVPKMDMNTQKYSDQYIYDFSNGIICQCSSAKVFYKRESFQNHWKSQRHKNWLIHLNNNAENYYQKCIEHEKTIKNQQQLLTKMQNELQEKMIIIHYLESSAKKHTAEQVNLMEFD